MVCIYRIASTGDLRVELYRDESPELVRAEHSGWKVCGCYRKGISQAEVIRDLMECR